MRNSCLQHVRHQMKIPPQPCNVGKRRTFTAIDGRKLHFVIEDEIVRPQNRSKHQKLIYFQKIRFEEDQRLEYRFTYYMLGLKPGRKGRWVFGQYSLLIPAEDLSWILEQAKKRGWKGV